MADQRQVLYAQKLGAGGTTLAELLAIMRRPAWHADAACKEHPELSWFPGRGEPLGKQQSICRGCPVRKECQAAGAHEAHGVWGGTSAVRRGFGRRRASV